MKEHNNEIFNVKLDGVNYEVSVVSNDLNILYEHNNKKYNLFYKLSKETLELDEVKNSFKLLYNINFKTNKCNGEMCSNVERDIKLIKEIINKAKK